MGTQIESQIQRQIVQVLSAICNQNHFLFFSVPNEAMGRGKDRKSNAIRMNMLKTMGLTPGVSDLVIVHDGLAYFVEIKKPGGKQSENQKHFMRWAVAAQAHYSIVRCVDDMLRALAAWEIIK